MTMHFEIEESFKTKIYVIINEYITELFGTEFDVIEGGQARCPRMLMLPGMRRRRSHPAAAATLHRVNQLRIPNPYIKFIKRTIQQEQPEVRNAKTRAHQTHHHHMTRYRKLFLQYQ